MSILSHPEPCLTRNDQSFSSGASRISEAGRSQEDIPRPSKRRNHIIQAHMYCYRPAQPSQHRQPTSKQADATQPRRSPPMYPCQSTAVSVPLARTQGPDAHELRVAIVGKEWLVIKDPVDIRETVFLVSVWFSLMHEVWTAYASRISIGRQRRESSIYSPREAVICERCTSINPSWGVPSQLLLAWF